ncbi:hypothetical protein B0H34DRAFT_682206 [Crassisporium funariophilum]|nr:hypothetical protein B0H34DRAFT_682206 [Crassisporium funariophilum]
MAATHKANQAYENITTDTAGHYFVGMNPDTFLDKFLPWNASTARVYKQKVPRKWRRRALRSVPPHLQMLESSMYPPFVKALDKWARDGPLTDSNPNPRALCFLHSKKPDTTCDDLNVDVSTYWEDDLPKRTTFSSQQTHIEFKPTINYDAFQHEADQPNAQMEDPPSSEDNKEEETNDEENANQEDEETASDDGDNQEPELGDEHMDDELPPRVPDNNHPQEEEDLVFDGDEADLPPTAKGVETDTDSGRHTRGQIAAYAGLALSMAFRGHFFSMLIMGRYARFIRWDRRGAVVTYRFDYTRKPDLIFNFYLRYGQLTLSQRGFDTTVEPCEEIPPVVKDAFNRYYKDAWYGGAKLPRGKASPFTTRFFRIQVTDSVQERTEAFFIPAPQYTSASLFPFCRATRRSLACPNQRGDYTMCFLKDSWQEVSSRAASEADVYRILEKAKVEHVASMRLGGDVEDLRTETQEWFDELAHNKRYRKPAVMVCHRLVLNTVARDLSTFMWCKVLLSCVADAVEGAQQAYQAGVLHRDLSAGNIMIVKDKKTNEWRGVLIDWDMSLLWKKHEGEARTGRTGTWAFISAKILRSPHSVAHTLWDDMESAFWVLIYQALRYLNHDHSRHRLFDLFNRIFNAKIAGDDGSMTGGLDKITIMTFCTFGRSQQMLPRFKVKGLNKALEQLGTIFDLRYADTEPAAEEQDPTCITNLLRKAALAMEPLCITPTGLVSPTNDSKPPSDPEDWQGANIDDVGHDWDPMPWSSGPEESAQVQQHQTRRVNGSMFQHLDGQPLSKRSWKSDPKDEEGPSLKKQRQVPPT